MAEPSENPKRLSAVIIAAIITAVATLIVAIATIVAAWIGIIPEFWKPLPAEVNLTTHVSDLSTGASIRGAKFILLLEGNSYVEYSDSDGNHTFRVDAARRGDARLFVEAPGYEVYDTSIGLAKDRFVDLKLVSKDSNNHKIIVRVVDDGSSLPIEGARVVFLANGNTYSATTDSNGIAIFTIEFTSETIDVDISVSTANYQINNQQVTVRPDQVQDIRLNKNLNELSVVPLESSGTSSPDGTGSAIAYNQILSGSINAATQKDRYTFNGNSGDVVLITIAKIEGDLFPQARLYDPEGKEIRQAISAGAMAEMNVTLPVTGEYIILVGDGFDGTRTGQYTLNLQKIR